MREVIIASSVRTPVGRAYKGALRSTRPDELAAVAATLNRRPRKTLGWKTPAEALDEYLGSYQQGGVATIP